MDTETACQENCFCNENFSLEDTSEARESLMDAGLWKVLPKVFLPAPAFPVIYFATRIQALHSNRQEIVSSQCNPRSCSFPAKQA